MTHPFRNHEIRIYKRVRGDGAKYHGWIGPTMMRFSGDTEEEVFSEAEKFRLQALADHEAALIIRQQAANKRKTKAEGLKE